MHDNISRESATGVAQPNENQNFWRSKHVIVTGGAGFLGSIIVRKLHERSAGAVIVPRSQECDLRRDDHLSAMLDRVLVNTPSSDVR